MNEASWTSRKQVYERVIDWDYFLVFPFESTFKTMKCLYGNDSIVTLEMF